MTIRPAKAIAAFEDAVRDHAFKGAAHPADWDIIEQRYEDAKARLVRYIERAAARESSPRPNLYRHEKRGTTYTQIGRGALQASGPVYEGAILVAYVAQEDGRLWFRPADEFDDGRFTKVES